HLLLHEYCHYLYEWNSGKLPVCKEITILAEIRAEYFATYIISQLGLTRMNILKSVEDHLNQILFTLKLKPVDAELEIALMTYRAKSFLKKINLKSKYKLDESN